MAAAMVAKSKAARRRSSPRRVGNGLPRPWGMGIELKVNRNPPTTQRPGGRRRVAPLSICLALGAILFGSGPPAGGAELTLAPFRQRESAAGAGLLGEVGGG